MRHTLTTKTATSKLVARPFVTVVEIYCPAADAQDGCVRDDPIPAGDGSFMHDSLPETITCPDCGRTFRVSKRVMI